MTFDYYTYTAGPVTQKAFNAVATFFNTESFADYLQICIMVGLLASTVTFMLKRDHKDIGKWMAVYTLVPLMLINMKGTVFIIDKTQPGRVYNVDNVPYLVALPTSVFSSLMVGMAEGVEGIFTTSDDERYGRTGMLFGSELFQLSRYADVRTAALRDKWSDYFENCLYLDVQINRKFTWDALFGAEDVFAFLDTVRQSPLRGLYLNDVFHTCDKAYPLIKKAFADAAGDDINLLAQHLWGKNAQQYKAQTEQALQRSYAKFVKFSTSASNIIKQNMVMNAIRYNIDASDPQQTAMNYAYTTNKMHTSSMWASLGLMAREYLPMLHTHLFLLFSALGFFIAGAAMIPSMTQMVLTNYAKTFAYLATWPTLFALINAMQLFGLEMMSEPVASKFGGLTLSNANPLDELHSRWSWMTGIFMMSVPVIAGYILKGGNAVLSNMNYQMASMINATNARASAASSSGNADFGNLQMDNHSFNNTSANKFDDNTLTNTGHTYTQNADGSMTTQHADGHRTFNATPAVSQANFQTTAQSAIQQNVQDNLTQTQQSIEQNSTNLAHNVSSGIALSDRWNDTVNQNLSYGHGHNTGIETQVREGMDDMQSAVKSVSQATGWTEDQSKAYLRSMSAGGGIGLGGKNGGGKPGLLSLLNANAGMQWSNEDRDSFSKTVSENEQLLNQATQQYSQGASTVTRAGEQVDSKDSRSDIEQFAHDFATNYNEGRQLTAQANKLESDMLAYSTALTRLESDSASFTANHIMGFQSFLENRVNMEPGDVQRLMTAHKPEDLQEVKERYGDYVQTEAFKTLTNVNDGQGYQNQYDANKPTQHMVPQMSDNQRYIVEAGAVVAKADATHNRDVAMNERQSWELFNQDQYQQVATDSQTQQRETQSRIDPSITPPPSPKIRQEVEFEVGNGYQGAAPRPDASDTASTGYNGYRPKEDA
ncbi:conjugal transfer protein TraG [Vibrio zhanjiangensis]|uniref:Conjugal transfer protein TraG n=1 Tax=Vibrio zhanjiangensis TaxID=1046128 RepID=A0ABQ6F5F2_9VIBR|nr:conjugal transfer mating-pair stabilization protein TraG [Vibrio zhanjiangensis]GLT20484.1 conjugal transfer protein TraG [Vibrio zhanjiangensis]